MAPKMEQRFWDFINGDNLLNRMWRECMSWTALTTVPIS